MSGEPAPSASAPAVPVCAYCLAPVGPEEAVGSCPICHAVYHRECWEENGGCAVYGCSQVPVVESRRAIEVPMSYWGQELKPCPACGQQIQAAAVRCRHCGATFASARPQNVEEFHQRTALEERLPGARKVMVWIFVFSMLPFLAPVGLVWNLVWSRGHEEEIAALPSLYAALRKMGLIVASIMSVALAVTTLLYAVFRAYR